MSLRKLIALTCAAMIGLVHFAPAEAAALGAANLRLRHGTLAPQLANNAFGGPVYLQSNEVPRRLEGDVYAVLDHSFASVNAALSDPAQWCDVLILHLNTKHCRRTQEGGATQIDLRVGKKTEQAVEAASLLRFSWRAQAAAADYMRIEMQAPQGPYDTRDYQLMVEAIPLDDKRTFLHMGYTFGYGGASQFALTAYLATLGRDKVGFSKADNARGLVGGLRGVAERNTMRYYLAIDAYLGSLAAAQPQQLERRLTTWFDATERFARQLHEVSRDDYLRMKRNECRRLLASAERQ